MTMEVLEWFPFYGEIFFRDEKVQQMSNEQVGMYMKLLQHQWKEGSIPALNWRSLGSLGLRDDERAIEACSAVVLECFKEDQRQIGRLFNPRLEKIRREQHAKIAQRKANASKAGRSSAVQRGFNARSTDVQPESTIQNQNQNQKKKENKESLPNGFSYDSTEPGSMRRPRIRSALDLIDQGLMPNLDTSMTS